MTRTWIDRTDLQAINTGGTLKAVRTTYLLRHPPKAERGQVLHVLLLYQ
jgi:hypothetical protein